MARILLAMGHPTQEYAFMIKRILGLVKEPPHAVTSHESYNEALTAAKNTFFDLTILVHTTKSTLDFELAQDLTRYDPTLPLMLSASYIPTSHRANVAQIPFKAIFLMPFSPQHILAAVDHYARG